MKELRIKKMSITSFKGQTREIVMDGNDCMISGKNGVGKSTIMKAWLWLMSGYTDCFNPKNHELYDNTKELDENTPIASVKASIKLGEYDYTIERNAKASFSRKRGEETYTKDASDKYTFKIDDIEVSVKNFTEWIEGNICPKDLIQYMVDGSFLAILSIDDKDKCRKVLENIIGEIKQEDFKNDYTMLFKMMERYTIDNLKEQTKQRMRLPKKRLEELPALIESKQADVANLETTDYDNIAQKAKTIQGEIKSIDETLKGGFSKIQSYIDKRNKEIASIEEKKRILASAKTAYDEEHKAKIADIEAQIAGVERENERISKNNEDIDKRIADAKAQLVLAKNDLQVYTDIRLTLLKERNEVKDRVFAETKCAYCGQELPQDKMSEMQEAFNKKKRADVDKIVAQGKANNEKIKYCQERVAELEKKANEKIVHIPLMDSQKLKKELNAQKAMFTPYEETREYLVLHGEIVGMENSLTAIPETDNDALTLRKSELMEELENLNKTQGKQIVAEQAKKEIQALLDEQKANGVELAKLQRLEAQINAYVEEKAQIISYRVNDLLDFAKIDMQERQKDGNLKPSATICRKDGVKYATLNNSDRILTIIDLQMMFNKHFNVSLPVFVDEASTISLSRIPQSDEWQKIFLKYGECDFKVDVMGE